MTLRTSKNIYGLILTLQGFCQDAAAKMMKQYFFYPFVPLLIFKFPGVFDWLGSGHYLAPQTVSRGGP